MVGYLILTLGGLLFGAMVYRYDMHEREPWWMLVLAVALGGLAMFIAFELEDAVLIAVMDSGKAYDYGLLHATLAGTIEEAAKLAVPVGILLLARRHFNDPMDGLLYGSLAGLGAGLYESAWYMWLAPAQADTGALQEYGSSAMRLFIHAIWGGIGGFALGLVVMKKPWRLMLARCVGGVMLIHFAWDYFVGFETEQTGWHKLVAALLLSASIVWYGSLVVRANKWSRAMHAPTSKQRLVGRFVRAILFRKFK